MSRQSYEKPLTANDTGETGGHQAGVHIPKSQTDLLSLLPWLDPALKNPDAWLEMTDDTGIVWRFHYIYYNNKLHDAGGTRDEYRITHMTGYFRAAGATAGDSLVLTGNPGSHSYNIHVRKDSDEAGLPSAFVCAAGAVFTDGCEMLAGYQNVGKQAAQEWERHICGLPVGVLHLGIKTEMLKAAGFHTIGDVRDADPAAIARAPLVGWRTVEKLVRNRKALANSAGIEATVDWAGYCETIGVPLISAGRAPVTGEEFLKALPVFFNKVSEHLSDEIFAVILRERICQPPGRQMTLDLIAGQVSPALSRERIRQKEKKLLGQLTGGLLNDSYNGLDIHFHPGFSHWWRMAADALSGIDDIDASAFIELLCEVWSVPHESVMSNLPAILAIVTGEPQMSGAFRSATRINPKFFAALGDDLQNLSVRRLRFGKLAAHLEQAGLPALGDVVAMLRNDGLAMVGAATAGKIGLHLELLASCITSDGAVDWSAYRKVAGLTRLPASAPDNTTDFVSGLCLSVEALLRLHPVTKRAPEIFARRTSRDAANRMTLQRVADELHTHLPTVKREETVLLAWLYDVIIDRNFSSLQVWLEESWLRFWSEASDVYDAADDYNGFTDNLAWRWRLSGPAVRQAAPLLWAVLDGYPDSRRSGYTPPCLPSDQIISLGRIHLKGFRRCH